MKKLITTFLILCIMLFMASCGENAGSAEGKNCESYTPTPEFWAKFDAEGITDEMVSESVHHGTNCAQYLQVFPELDSPAGGFDFFSVDFFTETMPDSTYWALACWDMDKTVYMERNGYSEQDGAGAYGLNYGQKMPYSTALCHSLIQN